MICLRVSFALGVMFALIMLTAAKPDGSETLPLPGPGLSYGGIPYGSVSGNVADFFSRQASPGGRSVNHGGFRGHVDFTPIEQYL